MRHYQDGDIKKIKLQDEQLKEKSDDWAKFNHPDTIVFEDGEKVLVIVRPIFNKGRICLVALIGKDSGYKSIHIFKAMKKLIDDWLFFGDAERVEFTTQKDFKQANRLAILLGFEKEGTLKKYYNGIDFNIWGRVI